MHVLITGVTGFLGNRMLEHLLSETDATINAAVRDKHNRPDSKRVCYKKIGDILPDTNWEPIVKGCQTVIHMAARVHVMNESLSDPLSAFRSINVHGTLNLARQAAKAQVKRFIFISSIKVNGEVTKLNKPFTSDDPAAPQNPYAISKYEAEQALLALAETSGMEVVIIRPPLIYGSGVKGNFLNMIQWLQKARTLPLGAVNNRRSFVSLNNLVSFIATCMTHESARNKIFLISDDEDVSTAVLLRRISYALDKSVTLLPVPTWALLTAATLAGKRSDMHRLCSSLQVNIRRSRDMLQWRPVESMDEALQETVKEHLKTY